MQKIEVGVDKRTELLGILLRLSDYKTKYPDLVQDNADYHYLNEIYNVFGKYKNHKAVLALNEVLNNLSFCYDAPVALFLQLDENYHFKGQNFYPFVDRLKQSNLIVEFLNNVKDFVENTKFEEFYKGHSDFYLKLIDNFKKQIDTSDLIEWMTKFFKKDFDNKNFFINLLPLQNNHGYYSRFENKVYCSAGSFRRLQNGLPQFGNGNKENISHYLHEFCHSVINPLTDKYFNKEFYLPDETRQKMKQIAYSKTAIIVNESIIRAIQIVYMKDVATEEEVKNFRDFQIKLGFIWIDNLTAKLEDYRNSGKSFEECFFDIANTIPKYFEKQNDRLRI